MNIKEDGISKKFFNQILLLITFAILIIFAIMNLSPILLFLGDMINILSPLFIGFAIAFIVNLLSNFFEEKIFGKAKRKFFIKIRRGISILLSFILIFGFISILICMIFPQAISSISLLTINAPLYANKLYAAANDLLQKAPFLQEQLDVSSLDWQSIIINSSSFLTNMFQSIVTWALNFTSGIITAFISIVFAIYLLAGKDKLITSCKNCVKAFLPEQKAEKVLRLGSLTNSTFSHFVSGQVLEAIILGTLCFLGMLIFRFEYALLISTIIGVTALIPIFGAFIGAIIGAVILFMISPLSSICFVIYIIILQQIEGNIIYPKVVGTSLGLSGFWVLVVITLFGGKFGIMGILLGIPLFSVFSTLFTDYVSKKTAIK